MWPALRNCTLDGGQGSAVSPCWHVDTYHLYLIMSMEDRPREQVSEQLAEKKKPRGPASLFPFTLPSAVLHVTRSQERGKLNMSVAMEYRSKARPRARHRERNSTPVNSRISSMRWKIDSSLVKRCYNSLIFKNLLKIIFGNMKNIFICKSFYCDDEHDIIRCKL